MNSTLSGGLKKRNAKTIRGKVIDAGDEGRVHNSKVVLQKGFRKQVVRLVEKIFHSEYYTTHPPKTFRNPINQINNIRQLQRLNRKKKLGLNIVPTVRMRRLENGEYSLLTTKLNVLKRYDLTATEQREYKQDENRQTKILYSHNWKISDDAFLPVRKKGKVIAMIGDFGKVLPPKLK
jgi:hypothetical protein